MAAIAIFEELEVKGDEAEVAAGDAATATENLSADETEDAFGLADESNDSAETPTMAEEVLAESKEIQAALADQGFSLLAGDIADWDSQKRRDAIDWIEASNEWMMADREGKAEGDPPARPEWLVEADRVARERAAVSVVPAELAEVPAEAATESAATTTPAPAAPPAKSSTPPMSDPDFEIALQIVSADREIVRYSMIEAELKDRLKDVKKSLEGAVSERMELQRAQASRERDLARGQGMLPFGKSGMATGGFTNGPTGVVTADGKTLSFSSTAAAAQLVFGDAKEKLADEAGMNDATETADDSNESSAASGTTDPLPAAATDPGRTTPISALDITKGQIEKLEEADVKTVADLEAFMNAGKLQWVKGFGDKAVDRVSDAVFNWRQANPIPTGEA